MGEEGKQEEPKSEGNPEEKKEEEKKVEEEKQEEKKDEEEKPPPAAPPPPPAPLILSVNLHCVGCAKRVKRAILKCRGVEGVEMDMGSNTVTVKGMVDPEALCSSIRRRSVREAKIISPVLPPPAEGEGSKPQLVASQVSGLKHLELEVNMHCEACAQQLRRKILKMRGVLTAETDLSSGKVTVTGTMDADNLVDYVYRHAKKQARVVPQTPKEEETQGEPEKPEEEEKPAQEKAVEDEKKNEEDKEGDKKEEEKKEDETPEPKSAEKQVEVNGEGDEKKEKEGEKGDSMTNASSAGVSEDDDNAKKTMTYYWAPVYVIERPPPPQLFSDENPNACCIS